MAQKPDKTMVGQRVVGNPLVPGLYAMSFIIGAVALIGVLFQLGAALSRKTQPVQADEIVRIVMMGLGGVAAALLLAGLATIINYLQNQLQMIGRLVRAQEDVAGTLSRLHLSNVSVPGAGPASVEAAAPMATDASSLPTSWIDSQRLEQISELLQDLNENVLLSPEMRNAKHRQHLEMIHRNLGETLSRLLVAGRFPEAQRRLDEYARSFPDERQTVEQFQAQIEAARCQAEEGDFQQAAVRVRDFMDMAAWERADEVIQELLVRHPRSQRVRDLVEGLRQQRSKFEQLQRQQTLSQIEQLIGKKEYREAYRLACDLVHRFPGSAEAQSVQGKMDTLRDNAEIAIRKDLEEQLKELMRTHRYIEALALAQDIISKYPGSPQAKVLKDQMPQMMTKAKLQMEQVGGA